MDPKLFRETVRTENQAASRAVDIISSEMRAEIAGDNQAEIITTSREPIMNRILENSKPQLALFGIELVDVRIKRADFPAEIADSVYARMQAERKRKADKERAEGAEIDARVRAEVDRDATIIVANAEKNANILRGEGEAQAIQIFADAIGSDLDFYSFQRSLEAYQGIFAEKSTIVIPADSDLFQFLQSPEGLTKSDTGN
ncbi:MAG: protease modulator HflC [Dehalococcoidia bacterium]|nr:protease modulator HflC [Dehalococcoidia bacterium]